MDKTETRSPDWAAIRQEYEAGGIGQRALGRKHGVTFYTLSKRMKAEGWTKPGGAPPRGSEQPEDLAAALGEALRRWLLRQTAADTLTVTEIDKAAAACKKIQEIREAGRVESGRVLVVTHRIPRPDGEEERDDG